MVLQDNIKTYIKNRLNNFILWCKGWYESIDSNADIFDEAVIALKLDDYVLCSRNNVIGIVTHHGGFTSHVSLMAAERNIPYLFGGAL